jgi:hypothetical protein
MSLFEDGLDEERSRRVVWLTTRIAQATEALLHCANLYKALGIEPHAHIEMTVTYGDLGGRRLTTPAGSRFHAAGESSSENGVNITSVVFKIGALENEIVGLVKKLCEPLFVLFDFSVFPDETYEQIVNDFRKGKVN